MGRIVNQPFLTGKSNNFLLLKNTYRNQPYILKVFNGLTHPYYGFLINPIRKPINRLQKYSFLSIAYFDQMESAQFNIYL